MALDEAARAAQLEPREPGGMGGEHALRDRLAVADPERDVDPERARAARRAVRDRDRVGDPLRARHHRSRPARRQQERRQRETAGAAPRARTHPRRLPASMLRPA
jgi:hypothetical protein